MKVTVVGPTHDTGMHRLYFSQDSSGIRLIPEYTHVNARAAVYKNGRPLGVKATEKYLSLE
jgi:hypothetical protein